MRPSQGGLTVAIAGGGFGGAAVADHLARHSAFREGQIVVFEPRAHLGRGLAYDTNNDAHRVNVPANRLSLDIEDDDHFVRWLDRNDERLRSRSACDRRQGLPQARSFRTLSQRLYEATPAERCGAA